MKQPLALASLLVACVAAVQSAPALAQLQPGTPQADRLPQNSSEQPRPPSSGTGSSGTSGSGTSAPDYAEGSGGARGSTASGPNDPPLHFNPDSDKTQEELLKAQTQTLESLARRIDQLDKRLRKLEKRRP
jgi:opacity protein-like surface antigen